MPYPFLSTEWMDAAKAIREKYADQASPINISVRMNQVITDVPFGEGDVKLYLDTSSGSLVMESGELETPDLTLTTDYDTAKKVFVDQDQAAGMIESSVPNARLSDSLADGPRPRMPSAVSSFGSGRVLEPSMPASSLSALILAKPSSSSNCSAVRE